VPLDATRCHAGTVAGQWSRVEPVLTEPIADRVADYVWIPAGLLTMCGAWRMFCVAHVSCVAHVLCGSRFVWLMFRVWRMFCVWLMFRVWLMFCVAHVLRGACFAWSMFRVSFMFRGSLMFRVAHVFGGRWSGGNRATMISMRPAPVQAPPHTLALYPGDDSERRV
jgi:hypothetical protein